MSEAQTAADELAKLANTFKLASEDAIDGEYGEVTDARTELANLNKNKIGKIIHAVSEAMGKKPTEVGSEETAEGGGRRRTRSARRGKRRAKSRRRRYY